MSGRWTSYDFARRTARRRGGRPRAVAPPATLAGVLDPAHLYAVMLRMAANNGPAPGLDGVRYDDLSTGEWYQAFRDVIADVRAGTYRPQPPRVVEIVKAGGGTRELRLAVIADRVLEKAVADALTPAAEAVFLDCSWGFRPGRDRFGLLAALKVLCERFGRWVLTADDVTKAFDRVPVAAAVAALTRLGADPALTALAGVILQGHDRTKEVGIAQGGALSPLTLNVLLHLALDTPMAAGPGGHTPVWYLRYADNVLVITRTAAEGWELLERMRHLLAGVGLTLKGDPGVPRDLRAGEHLDALGTRLASDGTALRFEIPDDKWAGLQAKLAAAHDEADPTAAARTLAIGWIQAHAPAFGTNPRKDEETANRTTNLLRRTGHRHALTRQTVDRLVATAARRWESTVTAARAGLTAGTAPTAPPTATTPTTANATAAGGDGDEGADPTAAAQTDRTAGTAPTGTGTAGTGGTGATADPGGTAATSSTPATTSRPSGRFTAPPDRPAVPCGANRRARTRTTPRPRHRLRRRRSRGRPTAARPPPRPP